MMKRSVAVAGIVLLLWLGTFLRFYRLDAQSFWNDEGNSARLSERSPALIVEGTASDIHPPLYYLLLRGWRELVGDSEFGLRSLSAFAGLLVVAATYAIGRNLSAAGVWPAWFAALFVAVNPALIYYSQEARMYSLLALLAALATLLLVRILPDLDRPRTRLLSVAGYVLVVVAGLYTHYFFPAVLLGHNLLVLVWLLGHHRRLAVVRNWALLMLAAFLLYLPWLPVFIRQAGGRPGDGREPARFLVEAGRWLVLGDTLATAGWVTVAFLGLLVLGLSAGFLLNSYRRRQILYSDPDNAVVAPVATRLSYLRWILLVGATGVALPVLFMLVAGTTRPAYFKFMVVAVPSLALLLGQAAVWLTAPARWERTLALVLLPLLLAWAVWGSARSLQNMYFDPAYARADYRGMARRIAAENHPDAGVILNAANQWEVFTYYHRDGAPVYPVPRGQPSAEAIAQELESIAARHDRLYAIFWGEAERDPERLVERWLDSHAYKANDEWVGDVRFVTYALPREAASEMVTATDLRFGEAITLRGYTLGQDQVRPGDIVPLTLFWQAEEPLGDRYKVFLHLLDEKGHLVAQRDSEPGGGLALTTTWPPGEEIVDNHGLLVPVGTAPGQYTLMMGLYDLANPADRLLIATEGGAVDAYPLATITVE